MKYRITRDITVPGRQLKAGDVVDLRNDEVELLVGLGAAEKVAEPVQAPAVLPEPAPKRPRAS